MIRHGDCREVMAAMDANSVDAIVTDPPYGLSFMGKGWDKGVPGVEFWQAAIRVMKPGAYLLAFGGTRTFHRMAVAIEDAGFEIRDTLSWLYGQGFPKSLDVGKAIDKMAGAEREVVGQNAYASRRPRKEYQHQQEWGATLGGADSTLITAPATDAAKQWDGWGSALKPSTEPIIAAVKPFDIPGDYAIIDRNLSAIAEAICERIAKNAAASSPLTRHGLDEAKAGSVPTPAPTNTGGSHKSETQTGQVAATSLAADTSASTSDAASIALNMISLWRRILADACEVVNTSTTEMVSSLTTDLKTWSLLLSRITAESMLHAVLNPSGASASVIAAVELSNAVSVKLNAILVLTVPASVTEGNELRPDIEFICMARKPLAESTIAANVLTHGTGAINVDACRIGTDTVKLTSYSSQKGEGHFGFRGGHAGQEYETREGTGRWPANVVLDDEAGRMVGDAARFFYTAKASRSERNAGLEGMPERATGAMVGNMEDSSRLGGDGSPIRTPYRQNHHPTVKPISLMRWLVRLVTPPGGIVLDPFAGSGTTGCAAALEGVNFIGIEQEAEYVAIAERRIAHWANTNRQPALIMDQEAS